MKEGDSRSEVGLLSNLRAMLFGGASEPTLRDQIEEAIADHEEEPGPDAEGDLSPVERQMVRNLLHFGECTVDDVAVPRSDILAVPETIGFAELVAQFADAGHSRLPVYRDSLDVVTGMVHIKDVFAILAQAGPHPDGIAALIRQPLYVPQSMGVLPARRNAAAARASGDCDR